jgi:poly(3-hydroxybutyrate) depolymerase
MTTTSSSGSGSGSSSGSSGTSGGSLKAGDTTIKVNVMGRERTAVLHVPNTVSSGKLPLIIALHGQNDQASIFIQTSQLIARTDAVVVAPQGVMRTINFMGRTIGPTAWDNFNSVGTGNIDVPFLETLRKDLIASGSIEANRVSVFGYSQGGFMAYRYANESSGALACSAVIAAADGQGASTPFARKIPFILQVGSNDSVAAQARATRDRLLAAGHEVQYNEIAGANHSFPGSRSAPADFCLGKQL